ncbi:4a-hydroxytetrahydrobiopterin dehydratase [Nocardioidaceae bacterium]|nr:4a-hydroxytetrahydrobiopterin dehydratase [Nocardioidaceae bacterium]
MADGTISQSTFDDAELADWTWKDDHLLGAFEPEGFSAGARFALQVAAAADAMNHHPDIDLRYGEVTIRLTSHDVGGVSERDTTLARRISEIADEQELGDRAE